MTNMEHLTTKTNDFACRLKIADQLEGMTTKQKLQEMARRFALLSSDTAKQGHDLLISMVKMAEKYEKKSHSA